MANIYLLGLITFSLKVYYCSIICFPGINWMTTPPKQIRQTKKNFDASIFAILIFYFLFTSDKDCLTPSVDGMWMGKVGWSWNNAITLCCFRSDFILTASQDGHVKFWKKKEDEGIEFVKHFRSHLGMNLICDNFFLTFLVALDWEEVMETQCIVSYNITCL